MTNDIITVKAVCDQHMEINVLDRKAARLHFEIQFVNCYFDPIVLE